MEQKRKLVFIRQILKVLYAPHKAFREIAQTPQYVGAILIMILSGAMVSLGAYTYLSRAFVEQTLPITINGDQWTENSTLWASAADAMITESDDHIQGGFYGNKSIDFSTISSTRIWMLLNNIGPVDCSGLQGYKNVSLRVKTIYTNNTSLASASLYLFSSQTDYFYYNLTTYLLSANGIWYNLTIPLEPESAWSSNGTNADWSNINSVKLEFDWAEDANLTVRLDGLFFRGFFKSPLESGLYAIYDYFIRGLLQFVVIWIIIAAFIYLLTRGFGSINPWKPILILTGFALIPMVVQAAITVLAFSTLPTLRYPFEFIAGAEGEAQAVIDQVIATEWLASQILRFAETAAYVWIVALLSIMIHVSMKLGWFKSFIIGTVAFFAGLVVQGFILAL